MFRWAMLNMHATLLLVQYWALALGSIKQQNSSTLQTRSAETVQFSCLKSSGTGQSAPRGWRKNDLSEMMGWDKRPGCCQCYCSRGCKTDTTMTKRGFLQKKKLAPHILGIWVGKAKVETSHFSSILGLRKPFLPFLAAMHRTVTLLAPLR